MGEGHLAMTEPEIKAWVQGLGTNDMRRVAVMQDLLRHAAGDGMTQEDRVIVAQELRKLNQKLGKTPKVQVPRTYEQGHNVRHVGVVKKGVVNR